MIHWVLELERVMGLDKDNAGARPPKILWHYTDTPGALGILSEQVIRATHLAFTNDSSELIRGERLAVSEAQALVDDLGEGDDTSIVLAGFIARQRDGWALSDTKRGVYVASLCADKGNTLSQWCRYGDRGYSLGLAGFELHINPGPSNDADLGVFLAEIEYNETRYRQNVRTKLEHGARAVASYCNKHPHRAPELMRAGQVALAMIASVLAVCFKAEDFRDEKEWRIVALPHRSRTHGTDGVPIVQYRHSPARGLVPYVCVPLTAAGPNERMKLDRVWLGPAQDQARRRVALEGLLFTLGYPNPSAMVATSEIPYRP